MLSPKEPRILLLPDEIRMLAMLGWTEAEYRHFCREAAKYSKVKPGEPVAFGLTSFLVTLVVGIALNYAEALLAPRQPSQGDAARIEPRRVDGQDIVNNQRFASRSSFTGIQNVVELNSPIPIVFANREEWDGIWFGGIRVNTNLVWSMLWSIGGSQLFRGAFLVGESPITIDPFQTAMGDNLFGSYDLKPTDSSNNYGRTTLYFSPDGGPIKATDYAAGRHYTADIGAGSPEVFMVRDSGGTWRRKFVYAFKPQTQTQFGLYAPMGVGLGYRVNPRFAPAVTPSFQQVSELTTDQRIVCAYDVQRIAERDQQNGTYNGRTLCTILNGSGASVSKGDTFRYRLDRSSDYGTSHTVAALGGDVVGDSGKVEHDAAAQSIAARQRGWDESIVVGEMYQWGECRAVCTSRSPGTDVFVSDADTQGGRTIDATFKVIEGGAVQEWTDATSDWPADGPRDLGQNGTQGAHLFRCAVASFTVDRPCKQIEIGLRSNLGIRYNGMVDWGSAKPYEAGVPNGSPDDNLDHQACFKYSGTIITSGQVFSPQVANSGTYTGVDTRYSFFHVRYRKVSNTSGASDDFTRIRRTFGTRGASSEAVFNYLTLFFPEEARWEIQIVPVTGWQVRKKKGTDDLCVLDGKLGEILTQTDANGIGYRFNGDNTVTGDQDWFLLDPTLARRDLGLGNQDQGESGDPNAYTYVDAYGKLAELFWYEEIQSSVGAVPEHEITYVNVVTENPVDQPGGPTYANMALVGMNLRSATESNELGQLSVYCTGGQTYNYPGVGVIPTHRFPDCLEILLTNKRFGAGALFPVALIDSFGFKLAGDWTDKRKYFFDIGISQPINLISQANEWAGYFLLDLGKEGGKFTLKPTANFVDDGPHQVVGMFSLGNIIEDTIEVSYKGPDERTPPIVNIKWRYEDQVAQGDNTGIFPVLKVVSVRESSTPADAPVISVDISDFCTSEYQAIDYAKMVCRKTRLETNEVRFKTFPDVAAVAPGAVVRIAVETLTYGQPSSGVILNDGTVLGPDNYVDGDYTFVVWSGGQTRVEEKTITITDGKAPLFANSVFSAASTLASDQTYKVQAVDFDEDGNVEIIASLFPLDETGFSKLTENWEDAGSWVVLGGSSLPARPPGEPPFTSVSISAEAPGGFLQESTTFTAITVGNADSVFTYVWEVINGSIQSGQGTNTITYLPTVLGTAQVSVTVTDDVFVTHDATVPYVIEERPIERVFIQGSTTPIYQNQFVYDVEFVGESYITPTYLWTTTVGSIIGEDEQKTITIDFPIETLNQTGVITAQVFQPERNEVYTAQLIVTVIENAALDINGPRLVPVNSSYVYTTSMIGVVDPENATYEWTEVT